MILGMLLRDRRSSVPVAATRTWNSLSSEVTSSSCFRSLKTKLKIHNVFRLFPIDDCKVAEVLCVSTLTL